MLPRPSRVLVTNPDRKLPYWFSKTLLRTPSIGERPVVHIAIVCGFWQGESYSGVHPVFLLCFIIFCAQHPVSDTNMGLDQMRRIRVSFQFFAQGCHVNSQGSNVIFLRTAPYFLREGGMRQHFAHIMRQHTQQFVLDGGQMQFILAQPDAACREVDLQRTINENGYVR